MKKRVPKPTGDVVMLQRCLNSACRLSLLALLLCTTAQAADRDQSLIETAAGWVKYPKNPVLGGDLGTCVDPSVLKDGNTYRMWFSWRPKQCIALVESKDGIEWSEPMIVIGPNDKSGWENDVNRPVVIKHGETYQMWYTGQARGKSWIGYATSRDGKTWQRESDKPVVSADRPWEKVAVMCPHVLYDNQDKVQPYQMWYSGGEQNEPNAIGYASSQDGMKWNKCQGNPVFKPESTNSWEQDQVTACPGRTHQNLYRLSGCSLFRASRAAKDGFVGGERCRLTDRVLCCTEVGHGCGPNVGGSALRRSSGSTRHALSAA